MRHYIREAEAEATPKEIDPEEAVGLIQQLRPRLLRRDDEFVPLVDPMLLRDNELFLNPYRDPVSFFLVESDFDFSVGSIDALAAWAAASQGSDQQSMVGDVPGEFLPDFDRVFLGEIVVQQIGDIRGAAAGINVFDVVEALEDRRGGGGRGGGRGGGSGGSVGRAR